VVTSADTGEINGNVCGRGEWQDRRGWCRRGTVLPEGADEDGGTRLRKSRSGPGRASPRARSRLSCPARTLRPQAAPTRQICQAHPGQPTPGETAHHSV